MKVRTWAIVAGCGVLAAIYLQQSRMASLAAIRAANAAVTVAGKRALVCGGTSGIGEGIAKRLAKANYQVTIVGRDPTRGSEIVRELNELGGSGHDFIPCDAFLLSNAKSCANEFTSRHPGPLDALVLTQGMATIADRSETSEGIDKKLSLHYYSRMAFIASLLPKLREAPSPRVMTVLSGGVHSAYPNWREDPELKTHFTLSNAANAAGFYNDLAVDALSQDPANSNVIFVHAAPGFVRTRWGTEMPWYIKGLVRAVALFATSPEDCAEYMCVPILRPESDLAGLITAPASSSSASTASGSSGAGAGAAGSSSAAGAGSVSTTASTSHGASHGGYIIMKSDATRAPVTSEHTPEARTFIWNHTLDVLRRTGVLQ